MNNRYSWLMYSVVLTVAAAGLWIAYKDHEKIHSALSLVGWQGFLFLCLFSSCNYVTRYLRWNYLLRELGDKVAPWESWLCYLTGFAFTTTPAKAGEAVRSLYFKRRHGVDYSHTLASLLAERTMDAVTAILIGALALYAFDSMRWIGALFSVCVVLAVFLISHQTLLLRIVQKLRSIKVRVLHWLLDLVPTMLARTNELFAPRPFTVGMLLGLVAWSAEAFAFAWLAQTLGGEASTLLYMSIFCISIVAGALTFVPGGLGGTEVVLYMLCIATGMGEVEALAATLLIRLATLWYAVALGLLSLLWLEVIASPIEYKSAEN